MYYASVGAAGAGVHVHAASPQVVGEPSVSGGRVAAELKMPSGRALVSIGQRCNRERRSLELKLVRPDGSREVCSG